MNLQTNLLLKNRPVKSLSARAFVKSARSRDKREDFKGKTAHIKTQIDEQQTFTMTKKQLDFFNKTAKVLRVKPKIQHSFTCAREPEQLHEQNLDLKAKLNRITDQLTQQKCRRLQDMKSVKSISKKFEIQFNDQKYFTSAENGGKSNLVQGIKYQYKKMKKMYQEKCKECEQLIQDFQMGKGEEYKVYCTALQAENKKLVSRLQRYIFTEQLAIEEFQKLELRKIDQNPHYALKKKREEWKKEQMEKVGKLAQISHHIAEIKLKEEQNAEKVQHLKLKLKESTKIRKQRQAKLTFLQKLLIQKDNELYKIRRQKNAAEKLNRKNSSVIAELSQSLKVLTAKQEQQIKNLKAKEERRSEIQYKIYLNSLEEKTKTIQKMTSQIAYLSTILTYVKPQDNNCGSGAEPSLSSLRLNKELPPKDRSSLYFEPEKSPLSISNRRRIKTKFEIDLNKKESGSFDEPIKFIKINSEHSIQGFSQKWQENETKQVQFFLKSSNVKHSEKAVKKRRVKQNEINQFKDELIYRFMAYKLKIDQVKVYFDAKQMSASENSLQKELIHKSKQRQRLITNMSQIQKILLLYPFELKEDQAELFARYIVEDSTNEFAYSQPQNQIQRVIAKSIIKAFVGEYEVPNAQEAQQQLAQVRQKYGKNLKSAMSSLAPNGVVDYRKIFDIMESIQIYLYPNTRNWIISELFLKSKGGLTALQYGHLFVDS